MRHFVPLRPGSRFGPIYRSGSRRRAGGITVLEAASQSSMPELGVVAGKGVGNAVQRNRTKRRLREAAQRAGLRPNTAYVVVASSDVLEAPFDVVAGWMEQAVVAGDETRPKDRK